MKKVFIIYILSLVNSLCGFGQKELPVVKHNYFVGGIISFNIKATDIDHDNITVSNRLTTFELSPDLGYFIFNRLALGFQINSLFTIQKYLIDGSSYRANSFLITPLIRYYFYQGFFAETGLGYGVKKTSDDKWNIYRGKVNLGYSIFLNERTALEPIVSVVKTKENTLGNNNYKLSYLELNFSLGLQSYF